MNNPNVPDFEPGGNRYLVLPDVVNGNRTTIGEITISEKGDPHKKASEGTVIVCGKTAVEYEPGDKVVYGQYSGYEQTLEDTKYIILQETEILGRRPKKRVVPEAA